MDESRFRGRRNHGKANRRMSRIEVQQYGKENSVANIRIEIEMILRGFLVLVARNDLTGSCVNEDVERFRERWTLLDVMVANESKYFMLGIDRDLVIE